MTRFFRFAVIIHIIVDYITVVLSFLLGYMFWEFIRPEAVSGFIPYIKLAYVFAFFYIFIFWLVKLYEEELGFLNVEQLRRIIKSCFIGTGVLFSLGFVVKEFQFSRMTFVAESIILLFLMLIQRTLLFRTWQILHKKGIGIHKIIIVGSGFTAVNIFYIYINSPWLGVIPIGYIDDKKTEVIGRDDRVYPVIGCLEKLEEIIKFHNISQVVVADNNIEKEKLQNIFEICMKNRIRVKVIPNFYTELIQRVEFENFMGVPIMTINKPRNNNFYLLIKRLLDIVISLCALLSILPVMLIISFLVKFTSEGPIFFSQDRVGKDGKIFKIYKFRSMYINASKYEKCPNTLEDQRITKIGRFLRRSSLDELPQLYNVLKGDMSMVGPRPEMPFIVESYNNIHRNRLRVKPGVTGLWQISHKRGAPIHENIDFDLYYVENKSFSMDLAILLNTFLSVIRGIGAC